MTKQSTHISRSIGSSHRIDHYLFTLKFYPKGNKIRKWKTDMFAVASVYNANYSETSQ